MNNSLSKNKKNKSTINIDRESIAILILKKDNFHLAMSEKILIEKNVIESHITFNPII
jgi:hypothetical protein